MSVVKAKVPMPNGAGMVEAVTAIADGITEIMLNDKPHVGLVLVGGDGAAILSVMTPNEAAKLSQGLSIAAVGVGKKWGSNVKRPTPTYASAENGGTPHNFWNLDVRKDGRPFRDCVEVNVAKGWARVHARDGEGNYVIDPETEEFLVERVEGNFSLHWRE